MQLDSLPIGVIDIIVLGIILLSALRAYFKGLVKEILAILSWVGGGAATIYGYDHARPYVEPFVSVEPFTTLVSALAMFLVGFIGLSVVTSLLTGWVNEGHAGAINKALGFVFGLARGALIVSFIYITIGWIWDEDNLPTPIAEARSLPAAQFGARLILEFAPDKIRKKARIADDEVDRTADKIRKANELYQSLNNPVPKSNIDTDPNNEASYRDSDRDQLDDLIKQAE